MVNRGLVTVAERRFRAAGGRRIRRAARRRMRNDGSLALMAAIGILASALAALAVIGIMEGL